MIDKTIHRIHCQTSSQIKGLLLCVLAFACVLSAAAYNFHTLGVRQGLSSNTVNTMMVDSRGMLWVGTSMGLNRYDGYGFRVFNYFDNEHKLPAASVRGLKEDGNGDIWVTYDNGTVRYDIRNQQFVTDNQEYLRSLGINLPTEYRMTVDGWGNLWFVCENAIYYYSFNSHKHEQWKVKLNLKGRDWSICDCAEGLYLCNEYEVRKFLSKTGKMQNVLLPEEMKRKGNRLHAYVDTENTLWVFSTVNEGIYHSNGVQLSIPRTGGSNAIRDIYDDGRGKLWVATDHNGAFVFDRQKGEMQHLLHSATDPTTIASDNVTCITSDRHGTTWLGHFKTGVSYSHSRNSLFQSCGMQYGDISTMLYDSAGNLWIGTDGGGVYIEHPDASYAKAAMPAITISSLLEDHNGTMWVGAYNGGLYKMRGTAVDKVYTSENGALANNAVWQMAEDNHHNIWIASGFGQLSRFSLATEKAEVLKFDGQTIQGLSLAFDGKHTMYIGTYYGVWAYDTNTGKAECLTSNRRGTQQLLQTSVVSLCYDTKHDALWVAHATGVSVLNVKRDSLIYFNETNGLFDNYVKSIVQDKQGNMWLSTSHGISCVQAMQGGDYVVHNFAGNEGLQNPYFNTFAAVCSPQGYILMGGNDGYTLITPQTMYDNKLRPTLTLSEVMVGDRQILPDGNTIRLSYDDYQISLRFFTGDLSSAGRVLYAYRVRELGKEWVYTDKNEVKFFSLAHGSYTLEVKAADENGEWGEVTTLYLKVSPPFYLSWWMKLLYLLLLALAAYMAYRYVRRRHRRRIEEQRISMEQAQQAQLSEMKLRFFTNISHDLRTPLTLIISPLQTIIAELKNGKDNAQSNPFLSRLEMVYRNAQLLYNQVSTLLDFRRLDVGAEKLTLQSIDVAQYVGNICLSFQDYAHERGISLTYESQREHIYFTIDAEKLNKIMYNLLSNALKFTPDSGSVKVSLEASPQLRISVSDTGCGISDADKTRIFQRFYQVRTDDPKAGSGIGLHIVSEYVRMHGGTITVTDNQPQGTVFTIEIENSPSQNILVKDENGNQNEIQDQTKNEDENDNGNDKTSSLTSRPSSSHTTILVVDDNTDLRHYIVSSLCAAYGEKGYEIIEASDGVEALECMKDKDVTLIVTDIMMPRMDGMELTHRVKTNIQMSHIPVIMLTAKQTDRDIVSGLKQGADDYLTKPFSMEHLLLRIDKFIEWQQQSHEMFRKKMEVNPSDITITPLDEQFVQKALSLVEEHMADSDYSVEQLSSDLHMSRANLYKKMMSITGQSPHDFMRSIRLKRACQLLERSQLQVSEIAYAVGYSSPKRFSENFKAEYGMTPSEYMKKSV